MSAMTRDQMTSLRGRETPRWCRRRRRDSLPVVMAAVLLAVGLHVVTPALVSRWTSPSLGDDVRHSGRHLLEISELNCTPRAIHNFPDDFMTSEQRARGGVTVHILLALYVFAALALVCDDYFVASLERICEVMNLQPDVAGATFMAAGSSAPELFTAIIGVFFAKSDVGIGTIVGSAVFNLLFINAICSLFAGMVIYLAWWPLARDCSFYALSVLALILVMHDELVYWYEGLAMVMMYVAYCILMYFNRPLGDYVMNSVDTWWQSRTPLSGAAPSESKSPLLTSSGSNPDSGSGTGGRYGSLEKPKTPANGVPDLSSTLMDESYIEVTEVDDFISPLTPPIGTYRKVFWVLTFPMTLAFLITIPDCRRPGCWRRSFAVTFTMSIVWIAALSYVMVWMVTIAGDTLGIPDTVMGLTLLAAGTSVPDAMASLIVAREGLGDMAVSNSIGSNVFDILLCLGLPWLIQTGMVTPGSTVAIDSAGLTYSAITLLATIAILLVALFLNRWRLTRALGVACLGVYAVVITLSCLYELNVFGYLNPPPCPT